MNSLSANKTRRAPHPPASRGFAPWRAGHGQIKAECSAGLTALHVDAATVRMHDVDAHGESQARTLPHLLGGEEGLEDTRQDIGRDARAVVCHRHMYMHILLEGGDAYLRALPPTRHLHRVDEQVVNHLAQRRRIAGEFRQGMYFQQYLDLPFRLAAGHVADGAYDVVDILERHRSAVDARKSLEIVYDARDTPRAIQRFFQQGGEVGQHVIHILVTAGLLQHRRRLTGLDAPHHGFQLAKIGLRGREIAADEANGIIDLMSDTGCQLTHRRELLGLIMLPPGLIDGRDLLGHALLQISRELERRHEALQQSEARYRELAANLEQRVAEQVATIDQTRRQLYQSEKLAAVGQLAAGVAHEINNPIGFISSNLTPAQTYLGKLETVVRRVAAGEPPTVLQQACRDEDMDYVLTDFASLLEESLDGSRRVARIVNDLKGFSRGDGAAVALEDVNDVIRAVCNVTRSQTEGQVEVLLELHPLPKLSCNAAALGQVIYNLLINAVQVTSGRQGAQVRITTFEQDMHIHVTVADNGPGISADVLPRIFEPFFTTKEVGQGTGLGLTVCVDVVHAHGGRIDVQSGKTGTAFSLYLPVTGAPWSEASKGR